ncbi:MAG: porphobilinogen synthase, partial [Kiritimatiellae bacterium]|nr:porphobilinogen synthase [Kiritimatiellia bacterium]
MRRLRRTEAIRNMFAMDKPSRDRFIWPVFLVEGEGRKEEIPSMPGQYRWSVDRLVAEFPQGVKSALLFGQTEGEKDEIGSAAADMGGVVQRAIPALKKA